VEPGETRRPWLPTDQEGPEKKTRKSEINKWVTVGGKTKKHTDGSGVKVRTTLLEQKNEKIRPKDSPREREAVWEGSKRS